MTVSYSETISSSQGGVFIKILALWKGSLYKLVYTDLIAYLLMYYACNFTYRAALSPQARQNFELVVKFCNQMDKSIPLSFILGFFVAGVIGRWWQMYLNIPWLNRISFFSYGIITGTRDTWEAARRIRMTLMRYMNVGWILLMHSISEQIMHRFSADHQLQKSSSEKQKQKSKSRCWAADWSCSSSSSSSNRSQKLRASCRKVLQDRGIRGLLENINRCPRVQLHFRKLITEAEMQAFTRAEADYEAKYKKPYLPEYWLPLQWAALLCKKAMLHGFCDPRSMVMMMEEIETVRGMMQTLMIYNDVMIPLVYTQVVIIAVYSYFLLQLFSQQFVNPKLTAELLSRSLNTSVAPIATGSAANQGEVIDMYFPVFTVFQFLFLMGWLKVAMCVMNPFGDDDEDFHTSEILDYNLEISARCAEGSSSNFPSGLSEPSMEWIRRSAGADADKLLDFLEAAESEFNEFSPLPPASRSQAENPRSQAENSRSQAENPRSQAENPRSQAGLSRSSPRSQSVVSALTCCCRSKSSSRGTAGAAAAAAARNGGAELQHYRQLEQQQMLQQQQQEQQQQLLQQQLSHRTLCADLSCDCDNCELLTSTL